MYVLGYYNYKYYVHTKTDALKWIAEGHPYKIIAECNDVQGAIYYRDAMQGKSANFYSQVPHAAHGLSSMN